MDFDTKYTFTWVACGSYYAFTLHNHTSIFEIGEIAQCAQNTNTILSSIINTLGRAYVKT